MDNTLDDSSDAALRVAVEMSFEEQMSVYRRRMHMIPFELLADPAKLDELMQEFKTAKEKLRLLETTQARLNETESGYRAHLLECILKCDITEEARRKNVMEIINRPGTLRPR